MTEMNLADNSCGYSMKLTPEEVQFFHLNGFLGPYTLCSPAEMESIGTEIRSILAPRETPGDLPEMITALNPYMRGGFGRHHDNAALFALASSPAILNRVASIMGEDLLLWRTMFFHKRSGEKAIPWHQDFDDWQIEPMLVTSCWLAIDAATPENGCVELLPGSHRRYYSLVPSTGEVMDGFPRMSDPAAFNSANPVKMQLQPGQFFLFNERILHSSGPNNSAQDRMGLAIRYIPPMVRILDPDDHAILVSGQDKFGFNALVVPPQG